MFFKTEDLTAAAKLSEFFPAGSTATFGDPDDLINLANQEMGLTIVPLLMEVRQDYFSAESVVLLKNSLNHYAIPERSIGNALQDVHYLPDSTKTYNRYPLAKTQNHEVRGTPGVSGGAPSSYHVRGDEIVINSIPSGLSGTEALLFSFYMRPNKIVSTSQCAKITGSSVSGSNTVFTVDTDLTNTGLATVLSAGSLVDLISMTSPFRPWTIDVSVQAITTTTITLATASVQDESGTTMPQVGDYICPAQQACVPMIPQEMHPILSERIAFRALKALGAAQKLQTCAAYLRDITQGALKLIENRIDSEVDVVQDPQGFMSLNPYMGGGGLMLNR